MIKIKITLILSTLVFSFLTSSCSTQSDSVKNGVNSMPGMELKVLAYNIYMRPRPWFNDGHIKRVNLIPGKVKGYDVIVFSEVFDDDIRARLRSKLKDTYPYISNVVGKQGPVTKNDGGVIIFSKWLILDEDERVFGNNCNLIDCLSDKGVKYIKIKKNNNTFHIFGTHVQANNTIADIKNRRQQFVIIRNFIDSKNINKTESVIIAGDLNVPFSKKAEFNSMLNILDALMPPQIGNKLSKDGRNNDLADPGENALLDYVLYSKNHYQPEPENSFNEVKIFRSKWMEKGKAFYDLSDHYAVLGYLKYECKKGYHWKFKKITYNYTRPFNLRACQNSCKEKFNADTEGEKLLACNDECIKNSNLPDTFTTTKTVLMCVSGTKPYANCVPPRENANGRKKWLGMDINGKDLWGSCEFYQCKSNYKLSANVCTRITETPPNQGTGTAPGPVKDPLRCPPTGTKICPPNKVCIINKCKPQNTEPL